LGVSSAQGSASLDPQAGAHPGDFADRGHGRGCTSYQLEEEIFPLLGKNWHNAFMLRHREILWKGKACTKDINHQEWGTYENLSNMYKAVYKTMVTAGVSKKLPEAVWFDHDGNIVLNEEEAFGEKLKYFLEHSEYCVYVDETGSNTNQKQDGAKIRVLACGRNGSWSGWCYQQLSLYDASLYCGYGVSDNGCSNLKVGKECR
jgi:hypothetical protein